MEENRKRIAELNRKLKGSSNKNVQLEKSDCHTHQPVSSKETELSELNAKLSALNTQVAQLETSVAL